MPPGLINMQILFQWKSIYVTFIRGIGNEKGILRVYIKECYLIHDMDIFHTDDVTLTSSQGQYIVLGHE